jgi:nucleoside-diphosphate-sugar epimerase
VTKLAGEHLCGLYAANHGVPTVALRYFTVYGPRQRPDMAIHRLIEAALAGGSFPLYGDGEQQREFTFVDDVVAATIAAADADVPPGHVINVAGGSQTRLVDLIGLVEDLTGERVPLDRRPPAAGDVDRTGGATERARSLLGWSPQVDLRTGVDAQVAWHRSRAAAPAT